MSPNRLDIEELVGRMLAGEESSLTRLISMAESESPNLPEIMEMVKHRLGKACCIGITGPPGAGKSTLVDKLTAAVRRRGLSVGILAVDPSSPRSGGAMLGDRIRMQQHYLDDGVYIRSMASRGSHGGLSKAVPAAVKLLDAFGKDFILVETVGAGQTDLAITEVADITVLIQVPESGDAIQVMKAGLMEVADIIVVNKADHEGYGRLVTALKTTSVFDGRAKQTVLVTQAINNIGIEELYEELDKRRRACRM